MKLELFGKIILVQPHWSKGKGLDNLWWVMEKNDTERQYFLYNISLMENVKEKRISGVVIHILQLAITIGWL